MWMERCAAATDRDSISKDLIDFSNISAEIIKESFYQQIYPTMCLACKVKKENIAIPPQGKVIAMRRKTKDMESRIKRIS